jgi:hypothetical protein
MEFVPVAPNNFSDSGQNTPGSFSSLQGDDNINDLDSSLGRRTSRRERKPAQKPDLGYEEPRPIKGIKLSGASREIFRKCEETLNTLKEEFMRNPEFSSKATKFDLEIKNLRDGIYQNTVMLGNSIRKFLNNLFATAGTSEITSSKVGAFIGKFEESFASLDNKTLFEETKYDPTMVRKKSGSFGNKKKLSRQGSRSGNDYYRQMSDEEKKTLSCNIRQLTPQQLKGIIKIVKDLFPEKNGMLEFDIDCLPTHVCRELEEYVRNTKSGDNKKFFSGSNRFAQKPMNRNNGGQYNQFKSGGSAPGSGLNYRANEGSIGTGLGGNTMGQGNGLSNSKIFEESSDSESDSSNSSVGSGNLASGIMNK